MTRWELDLGGRGRGGGKSGGKAPGGGGKTPGRGPPRPVEISTMTSCLLE